MVHSSRALLNLPPKCSVGIDNPERVEGGVHHLATREEVPYNWDAEVGQEEGQADRGHLPDVVACSCVRACVRACVCVHVGGEKEGGGGMCVCVRVQGRTKVL